MLALAVNGGGRPRSSAASRPATRSACSRRDRARPPAAAPPRDRLDQPPRARARLRRGAARHARDRRRADRRPRAAGPALGGARRLGAAVLADPARVRRAALAPRRSRGGRRRGRGRAREVAQRRPGRRPQGGRRAGRGPPARGLGGGGDRRQRLGARRICRTPRRSAATTSRRCWPSCWWRSRRGWSSRSDGGPRRAPRPRRTARREGDAGTAARASADGIDADGGAAGHAPTPASALSAGEVHLGR